MLVHMMRTVPAFNSLLALRNFKLVVGSPRFVPDVTILPTFTFLISIASQEGNSVLVLIDTKKSS